MFIQPFRHRPQKTSKLRVTGLCEGNSPVTGEFPSQSASNAENVFIWWRYHVSGYITQLQPCLQTNYGSTFSLLSRVAQVLSQPIRKDIAYRLTPYTRNLIYHMEKWPIPYNTYKLKPNIPNDICSNRPTYTVWCTPHLIYCTIKLDANYWWGFL